MLQKDSAHPSGGFWAATETESRNMEYSVLRHKIHIVFVRKVAQKVIPSTSPTLEPLSQVVLDEDPF